MSVALGTKVGRGGGARASRTAKCGRGGRDALGCPGAAARRNGAGIAPSRHGGTALAPLVCRAGRNDGGNSRLEEDDALRRARVQDSFRNERNYNDRARGGDYSYNT